MLLFESFLQSVMIRTTGNLGFPQQFDPIPLQWDDAVIAKMPRAMDGHPSMPRIHTALLILTVLMSQTLGLRSQITRAVDVRNLPADLAATNQEVSLIGKVSFIEVPGTVFIQDETAGTFFRTKRPLGALSPGDTVEVKGVTVPGLYLTGIDASDFQIKEQGDPPQPIPAQYQDLINGQFHYQRVVIEAIGRRVSSLDENRSLIFVALENKVLEVRIDAPPQTNQAWVDARLRIVGLAAGGINDRRQLVFPYLRVTDWSDVTVIEPAPDPTTLPVLPAAGMLRFGSSVASSHRVKVQGVILASFSDGRLFIRDSSPPLPPAETPVPRTKPPPATALAAQLILPTEVQLGQAVELIGFPDMKGFSASLADAEIHPQSDSPDSSAAESIPVTSKEMLSGNYDADLITLPALLLETFRSADGTEYRLQADGLSFTAALPAAFLPRQLPDGSRLQVTGICRVESATDKGFRTHPDRASLLLRSPEDIVQLSAPTWWTAGRLLAVVSALALLTLLGAIWIASLRRQVAKQAASLRLRITQEAVFEERQRIAREFHDTLEQELTGLSLRLDAAATRPLENKALDLLQTSRHLVTRIQTEARNIVTDLRDESDLNDDLPTALRHLASRQAPSAPTFTLELASDLPPLPKHTVHHLRMIAQEAVTNALKHSAARNIQIALRHSPTHLTLTVSDDGIGVEPTSLITGQPGHFGCMGIRERCRKIHADVDWKSAPGSGTRVTVLMPLRSNAPES